eukprot:TRINITY_DN1544_c0_g3_i1.p1 TRINITY_DN1544_c0_g3~~TRINITY_DN1544_c0_g3_i1.p1  ORF type:complete len:170 (+),score=33.03 TRINITY_DN1544_c0_g3_i1:65-511(+)
MSPQSATHASPTATSAAAANLFALPESSSIVPSGFYSLQGNGSHTPPRPSSPMSATAITPFNVDIPGYNPFAHATYGPPRQLDWVELLGSLPHPTSDSTMQYPLQPTSANMPMSPTSDFHRNGPREPWEFLKLPPSSTFDGFLKAAAL